MFKRQRASLWALIVCASISLVWIEPVWAGSGSAGNCDPPNVKVRGKATFKNRSGQPADDFHVYVFQNDRPSVVVNGANVSSDQCNNVSVGLSNDNGRPNPPPGNHGAQVDMDGCTIPAGGSITLDVEFCLNERNCLKFKDVEFTSSAAPLPNPPGRQGFRVKRPFRGGNGGNRAPGGGGQGAQEGNGGSGSWIHIVCIENEDTRWIVLEELKLLASMTMYANMNDIDWAAIDPIQDANGEPPVCIPPGGTWCYYFQTRGAYIGGHVYLNYKTRIAQPGECPSPLPPSENGLGTADEPGDTDETIGDHPPEAELTELLPGYDYCTAITPTSIQISPVGDVATIPSDFFGPGSDPFEGQVSFVGTAGPNDGCNGDTFPIVIQRMDELDVPAIGSAATVPIQIVSLDLVSTEPIVVSFNGGLTTALYDVNLTNDYLLPSAGSLTATRTHAIGGTFTANVNVIPVLTFINVNDPGDIHVLESLPPILVSTAMPANWTSFPPPSPLPGAGPNFFPMPHAPIALATAAGSPATLAAVTCPGSGCACTVPDRGDGTAEMPPSCPGGYASAAGEDIALIIDGLPPGSPLVGTIRLNNIAVLAEGPGGTLGGEVSMFQATVMLDLHGTGTLAGFDRTMVIPVQGEMHSAPRTPGDPVQMFPTDMFMLQGQLFGDPDFDLLRITGGTGFGMPSPGHTTLTRLPDGHWQVDSFFDITYRIDFVGAPPSPLSGLSGSTTNNTHIAVPLPPVEPGLDAWETRDPTFITFGSTVPPIPPGFFGPGSDPFFGTVQLQGEPVLPSLWGPADTIIQRQAPANVPNSGAIDTVPIQIVELSLVSVNPIVVGTQAYDVRLTIDPIGPPSFGEMQIIRSSSTGGVFVIPQVTYAPRFTFTPLGGGPPLEYSGLPPIQYGSADLLPWSCEPPCPQWPATGPSFFAASGFFDQLVATDGSPWVLTPSYDNTPIIATDFDDDGDVDLTDFGIFLPCFNGPNRPPAQPGCDGPDLDDDGDVDLSDFGLFLPCFNGPNHAPPPNCVTIPCAGLPT